MLFDNTKRIAIETEINELIKPMFNEKVNITATIKKDNKMNFLLHIDNSTTHKIVIPRYDSSTLQSEFKSTKAKQVKKTIILDAMKKHSSWCEAKWYDYIIEPVKCESGAQKKASQLINDHIENLKKDYLNDINDFLNNHDKRIAKLWRRESSLGKIEPLFDISSYNTIKIIEKFPTIEYRTATASVILDCHSRKSDIELTVSLKAISRLKTIKESLEYIANNIDSLYSIHEQIDSFYKELDKIIKNTKTNSYNLEVKPILHLDFKRKEIQIDKTKIDLRIIEQEDLNYIQFSINKILNKYLNTLEASK